MSSSTPSPAVAPAAKEGDTHSRARPAAGRRVLKALSFRNISALYILALMIIIFSVWIPETFLQQSTWKTLLANQAVVAIIAIALVIPLTAGVYNLAIGYEVGFGGIFVAWSLAQAGLPIVPAIALTLLAGVAIGLLSSFLVVKVRINSFIATLGVSSVLSAMIQFVSGSQQILNLGPTFQSIATKQFLGVTYPVYIMLVIAVIAWYVLEKTPVGRRIYATGGNPAAARLSGVRTSIVITGTLVACGLLTMTAGIIQTATVGAGDPTVGPSFLLSAFAAAALGSTQFRGGRYNIAGTVVAVYVLATGVKGLQLAGAPVWIPDLFNGVALLIAVGMANYERTAQRASAVGRMLRRRSKQPGSQTSKSA